MTTDDAELQKTLTKILKFMEERALESQAVQKSQRNVLQKARTILAQMGKKEERILKLVQGQLDAHQKELEKVVALNNAIDETMSNVMLAIKQHEYLMAWHPPQRGQKEQYVVGKYAIAPKPEGS